MEAIHDLRVRVLSAVEEKGMKRPLDRHYTDNPFFGSRKVAVELAKLDFRVCRKKVHRLMRHGAARRPPPSFE